MKEKISVIVPCYNEEDSIDLFYNAFQKVMDEMHYVEFEIIFVDDGSKDYTLDEIKKILQKDLRARYISFSRNFGKEAAMYSGLNEIRGDYAVIIDVDLQHPPELIEKMYEIITKEKCDIVATKRIDRDGEPKIRSFFSDTFYKLINKISSTEIPKGATDYRLMKKQVVESILEVSEYNRFTKGIFSWVGYKTIWIPIKNTERQAGATSWSFWSLLKYSVEGIVAFSTMPLLISSVIGIILFIVASIYGVFIVGKTIIIGESVTGWPTLTCLILFLSGIQLFCVGVVGQYLAKTYLECKDRPIYIVRERNKG